MEQQMMPGKQWLLDADSETETGSKNKRGCGAQALCGDIHVPSAMCAAETLCGQKADYDRSARAAARPDDNVMRTPELQKDGEKRNMIEKTFPAEDDQLEAANAFVEEELEKAACPPKAAMQIMVALEEIFVNVAHYAYPHASGELVLGVETDETQATLRFCDYGFPFNPLDQKDPDIKAAAEERSVGGLGIFMVKKTMDAVTYERKHGQNILTITKKFR